MNRDTVETGFAGYPYSRESGLIRFYRYSWNTKVVEIGFEDGKLIWYFNFSEGNYYKFSTSEDPNTFFKQKIQGRFENKEFVEDLSDNLLLDSTTCLNRLLAYYNVGAYEKMVKLCDRIIQKKINEGVITPSRFSMENSEKAKALCKLGRYPEVLPLLEKSLGIYETHLKVYAFLKMNRLDQAIKIIKKLTKSRGKDGIYMGRIELPEVRQLFIELAVISSLKRPLTIDEKNIIKNIILKKQVQKNDKNFIDLAITENKKPSVYLDLDELEKFYQSLTKSDTTPSRYLSFDEARQIVQKLILKNETEWKKYCLSNNKPEDIPLNPKKEYSFEWKSWNDWLGVTKRNYPSYDEAKQIVSKFNLESEKEWKLFCKSGKLPRNIPSNPKNVYTSKWKDYSDWLGVFEREYLSFDEAKKFVAPLMLNLSTDWKEYCKSGEKPNNIPAKPDKIYEKQWKDWDDWLGLYDRKYASYAEQKKFVSTLNFDESSQWTEYVKSGKTPKNIPPRPFQYYRHKGIEFNIYDWFGINERDYLPFEEAKTFVRNLKLKNNDQFREWNNTIRPKNIPHNPSYVYAEKGWYGYTDWTGISH